MKPYFPAAVLAALLLTGCACMNAEPVQSKTEAKVQKDFASSGISQAEINWALQLETKVKEGYQPTEAEISRYQALFKKLGSFQ